MATRLVHLSRVDIKQAHDRVTGAITLKYVGRHLRFFDRLYGYPDGVFFSVILSELPLPEALTTLASAVGVSIDDLPLATELRRAVADVLCIEATMEAPDYLAMCADPRSVWAEADGRELERRSLAAENRVRELSHLVESALRRRIQHHVVHAPVRTYAAMPPAGFIDRSPPRRVDLLPPPEPVIEAEEVVEVDDVQVETSEGTAKRVRAAVKTARAEELSQRLPGGARRALARLPAGIYVSHGDVLERKADLCVAMMSGQEGGKRSGETALIDWDGEWPVVARRYGAHGRIVYRVEDALRRQGIAVGEAA